MPQSCDSDRAGVSQAHHSTRGGHPPAWAGNVFRVAEAGSRGDALSFCAPNASSLSKTGGAAPDTELTPEALANLGDERFAEVLNELQARGDREKLMQLFGQVFQWHKLRAEILN